METFGWVSLSFGQGSALSISKILVWLNHALRRLSCSSAKPFILKIILFVVDAAEARQQSLVLLYFPLDILDNVLNALLRQLMAKTEVFCQLLDVVALKNCDLLGFRSEVQLDDCKWLEVVSLIFGLLLVAEWSGFWE